MLSKVRINIVANYVGSIWSALLALISIPIYLNNLGAESFSFIMISMSISVIFSLADFGMAASITREMARGWHNQEEIRRIKDVFVTLLLIYIPLVIFLALLLILLAPIIVENWLKPVALSKETIQYVIVLIGIWASVQLLSNFFNGVLLGLQKQVISNYISIFCNTIQVSGAIYLLVWIDISIVGFFNWLLIIGFIQSFLMIYAVYIIFLKEYSIGRFNMKVLRELWGFSLGVNGIGLLSIILTQSDKIVLSNILSLELFGYYALALSVSMSLNRFFGPIYNAVYPHYTELVKINDIERLTSIYHTSSQVLSVILFPSLCLVLFYSFEIIYLWTDDAIVADKVQYIVVFLIAGTVLNGLMQMPYALQLANGWLSLILFSNLILVFFYVPGIYFIGKAYEGVGVAVLWFLLNLIYVVFLAPIIHNKLLPNEVINWYKFDVFLPLIGALIPIICSYAFLELSNIKWVLFFQLVLIFCFSIILCLLFSSYIRVLLYNMMMSYFRCTK